MKLYTILIIMVFVLVPALLVNGKVAGDSGIVDITTLQNKKTPAQETWRHKQHDISVYYLPMSDTDGAYTVLFYRTENDTLRCYRATCISDKELSKAGYRWLNDSLVIMHLYDAGLKQSLDFKVSGYGIARGSQTTSIITNDKR